jgi:hypothetical protein
MLFDGKLDAIDLMAIDYQEKKERQEKLEHIVWAIRTSNIENFDITPLCRNMKIKLTPDEFNWILEQVQED